MKTHPFFSPAPAQGDSARHRLLLAAACVFGEKGPEAATVREIVRAAGQNVAAISYYFGSKKKLYHAVLECVVQEIHRQLDGVLARMHALRRSKGRRQDEALAVLHEFFRTVYLRLLSRNEAVAVARLIVREQMQPTDAFEVLYEGGIRELHEGLCFLVGSILGRNPRDRDVIIRTHALLGQVYFFVMSRETILRRLGWQDLEGSNAELVADILTDNLTAIVRGMVD